MTTLAVTIRSTLESIMEKTSSLEEVNILTELNHSGVML